MSAHARLGYALGRLQAEVPEPLRGIVRNAQEAARETVGRSCEGADALRDLVLALACRGDRGAIYEAWTRAVAASGIAAGSGDAALELDPRAFCDYMVASAHYRTHTAVDDIADAELVRNLRDALAEAKAAKDRSDLLANQCREMAAELAAASKCIEARDAKIDALTRSVDGPLP